MKQLRKIIFDSLTNPDGISYSSKRVGGFISLFATIVYAFVKNEPNTEAIFTLGGLTIAFFGLTSVDFKSIINNKIQTGDTDPAKI